jgi:uncharacterized protein
LTDNAPVSTALMAALAVTLFGGLTSGLAGFGFALVCVPLLLLIYPPQTVVTISILLSLLTGWIILPGVWRQIRMRTVIGLLPWAIGGIGVGVLLLRALDVAQIKLVASLAVAGFALAMLRGWTPGAESPVATAVAGTASGTLNAMVGVAGPPVVMLFVARKLEPHAFRTSIVAYFIAIDVAALVVLVRVGEIGWTETRTALLLLPAAAIGTFVGRGLVSRIEVAVFRRVVLVMVVATGMLGVVDALRSVLTSRG